MTLRPISLTDFSGGISENLPFDAFTEDATSIAKGFILDGTTQLRSQWACEAVTDGEYFTSVYGFDARDNSFLVALDLAGEIYWAVAPDDDTAVGTVTWNYLGTGTRAGTTDTVFIEPDTRYRFVCELPDEAAEYVYTAQTSANGGAATPVEVTEEIILFAGNGLLINACYDDGGLRPSQAIVLRASGSTLSAIVYDQEEQRYPERENHPTIADLSVPRDGVLPHANVGTMWGDRLFLADVFWYSEDTNETSTVDTTVDDNGTPSDTSDDTTTVTTTYEYATMRPSDPNVTASRRYRNAIWVSQPGQPYTYDNLSLDLPVSDDCQIVDLEVIDAGLLVYTTNAAGEAGLILLNGTSGAYRVEKLRNIAAPKNADDDYAPVGTMWQASGSFVCVDRLGGVWATNGANVTRLDGPASVDFRNGAVSDDHCAALGQYLFVAHSGRLMCMRAFIDTAGWTELLTPQNSTVMSMTTAGNSLYFIQYDDNDAANKVYRFSCGRTDGHGSMPAGSVSNELVFGTRTLVVPTRDGDLFARSQWHRVGVIASGNGYVSSITTKAAPALASGDEYTVALGEVVGERSQFVAPAGVGFVGEGSVIVKLTGDVSIESVTIWVSPGKRGW